MNLERKSEVQDTANWYQTKVIVLSYLPTNKPN